LLSRYVARIGEALCGRAIIGEGEPRFWNSYRERSERLKQIGVGMNDIIAKMLGDTERSFSRISDKKLADYDFTQTKLKATNVATDKDYQRVYKSFYVMGRRPAAWYEFYFGLLEREKANRKIGFKPLTVLMQSNRSNAPANTSIASARVRNPPIYQCRPRPNISW
jgi:hypothetical protein